MERWKEVEGEQKHRRKVVLYELRHENKTELWNEGKILRINHRQLVEKLHNESKTSKTLRKHSTIFKHICFFKVRKF